MNRVLFFIGAFLSVYSNAAAQCDQCGLYGSVIDSIFKLTQFEKYADVKNEHSEQEFQEGKVLFKHLFRPKHIYVSQELLSSNRETMHNVLRILGWDTGYSVKNGTLGTPLDFTKCSFTNKEYCITFVDKKTAKNISFEEPDTCSLYKSAQTRSGKLLIAFSTVLFFKKHRVAFVGMRSSRNESGSLGDNVFLFKLNKSKKNKWVITQAGSLPY